MSDRIRISSGFLVASLVALSFVAACTDARDPYLLGACEPEPVESSVARMWNEQLLSGIRRDVPSPTVHARNLFHASVAMWDAWAAFDPDVPSVMVDIDAGGDDTDREIAISYAAGRILLDRYARSVGAFDTITAIEDQLIALCLDPGYDSLNGDDAASVGNRIAAEILDRARSDGSLEEDGYVDPGYEPVNPPLAVAEPGTVLVDPNRWQPLEIEGMIAQNGLPLDDPVQAFIGSHWGSVSTFAIEPDAAALPIDPGPPPAFGTEEYVDGVLEVIAASAVLEGEDVIDIGPASNGANRLGSNDGGGHAENPTTGMPYEAVLAPAGEFYRAIAEFWADGPQSETPPGHWNTIANEVSDDPALEHRIGGSGEVVSRLEWDVSMYLALNGALHDAAVAAWGAKRHYDYIRPISMIRHLGGLGQSSDPELQPYHPNGLPLIDGLIEVTTGESIADGRHTGLPPGIVSINTWAGLLDDEEPSVAWAPATEWMPYQRPTFVTPAFAAYVSGHSTFSRAAAEVLTRVTGSEYFPGGIETWTVEAGDFEFDEGPTDDVPLTWATYFDASDQSGQSRIYGGIHVPADDIAGRIMGSRIGQAAWEKAQGYITP